MVRSGGQVMSGATIKDERTDVLVDDSTLRDDFFGITFAFTAPAESAFTDPDTRDLITDPLIIDGATEPDFAGSPVRKRIGYRVHLRDEATGSD